MWKKGVLVKIYGGDTVDNEGNVVKLVVELFGKHPSKKSTDHLNALYVEDETVKIDN